jgi:hypothetical protein
MCCSLQDWTYNMRTFELDCVIIKASTNILPFTNDKILEYILK